MFEKATNIAKSLIPPDKDTDPRPWRINVFLTLIVLVVVLAFHIGSASGSLSWMGITAVASADEVQAIDVRSKAILRAIYSPQIRAKVRERCDTTEASQRERINKELDRLLNEYRRAADAKFSPMPTCSEV